MTTKPPVSTRPPRRPWVRPNIPPLAWPARLPPPTAVAAAGLIVAATLTWKTLGHGWTASVGMGLLVGAVLLGPREVLMERFVGAAYDLALKVDGFDFERREGHRKNAWRSQLATFGIEMDYDFSELARAGTRKSKWISLQVEPSWSLWPREDYIRAITVRLPSWTPVERIHPNQLAPIEVLRIVYAQEFFRIPVEQLDMTVTRRLRRNRVTYRPMPAPEPPPRTPPRFADVVANQRNHRNHTA